MRSAHALRVPVFPSPLMQSVFSVGARCRARKGSAQTRQSGHFDAHRLHASCSMSIVCRQRRTALGERCGKVREMPPLVPRLHCVTTTPGGHFRASDVRLIQPLIRLSWKPRQPENGMWRGGRVGAPGQCGALGGSPSFTVLNSESEATFFHFILHHGNVPRGNSVLTTGNFKK